MTYAASWLADALRAAGLTVIEEPGWQTRGHGDMGQIKGVLLHHTAGPLHGEAPSLQTVINGRPDLSGPLANLVLGRSGTFYAVAAGRAYHAGAGAWQGVTEGNSELIGIEMENTGLENDPWPAVQIQAAHEGCSAILKHIGAPLIMVAGHKEYALPPGRKVDPSFPMDTFRDAIRATCSGWPA